MLFLQLVNYVILLTEAAFIHKRPPLPRLSAPSALVPQSVVSVSFCLSLALSVALYLSVSVSLCPPYILRVLSGKQGCWTPRGEGFNQRPPLAGREGALGNIGASLFLVQGVSPT